jgi:TPR repeat protein
LDRDEANLISRKIQERKGLALRCFGHAASMGNLEGMYLAAQIWHKDKDYPVALEFYEKAARENHIPSRIMYAAYQIYGLGGMEVDAIKGYNVSTVRVRCLYAKLTNLNTILAIYYLYKCNNSCLFL